MTDLARPTEEELVERVQALTARLEEVGDPEARAVGDELAGAIVQLYGEGLVRIVEALSDDAAAVADVRERLVADGVVGSLLLMHGLHPVGLETRVREALDSVRPYLRSHDGDVELLGLDDDVARLRLLGSCDGCAASAATLEHAIEDALREHAPDLVGLQVEGVAAPVHVTPSQAAAEKKTWVALEGAETIERGHMTTASQDLLVANVAGTLLAYRDVCAGCPAPLSHGVLLGGTLTCAACGRAYDLPRAGRCRTDEGLQLEPVPLLRGAAGVRVAVETAQDEVSAHGRDGTCELCPSTLAADHRHLLHLDERRILCVCETCWSSRSGDPELRPTGVRTLWLGDATVPEDLWSSLQIPIGLAFVMRSGATGGVAALYPSPAGATECELDLAAWDRLASLNPVLARLEPDAEAFIVNRLADPPQYVIAPIDQAYGLVGRIKEAWEGISGGSAVDDAVAAFFDDMRARAAIG